MGCSSGRYYNIRPVKGKKWGSKKIEVLREKGGGKKVSRAGKKTQHKNFWPCSDVPGNEEQALGVRGGAN